MKSTDIVIHQSILGGEIDKSPLTPLSQRGEFVAIVTRNATPGAKPHHSIGVTMDGQDIIIG